jgi:hypothetical protein
MRHKGMDARPLRAAFLAAALLVSMGASHRTANFVVETQDSQLAGQIAQAAEKCRKDLAVAWLGKEMPNWSAPCVMNVRVGEGLGAGGATTFVFDRGEVFGWRMSIQGSQERIFDSVLPHEITHMVFASHFRRPLPRWADEGGATSVEDASERTKHYRMLDQFLRTGRGIAFNRMFAMTEYPADVMPLYAQGFSLADYLIQNGGRRKYVQYLDDALQEDQWAQATQRYYGASDLGQLQTVWLSWIRQGHPQLEPKQSAPEAAPAAEVLVADARRPRPEPNLIHRIPRKPHEQARPEVEIAMASAAPVETAVAEAEPAVYAGAPGTVLPASGWQPLGSPAVAKSVGPMVPVPSEPVLARPQPVEPARQIILEWRQPSPTASVR